MGESTSSPDRWVRKLADYSWELTDDEGFTYRAARSYDHEGVGRWVTAWFCEIGGRPYLTIGGTYPTEDAAKSAIDRVAVFERDAIGVFDGAVIHLQPEGLIR